MPRVTVAEAMKRYKQGMANNTERIKYGVMNTDKDQSEAAIEQQDRMLSGVQQAVTSGRWADGLKRSGKKGWQDGMINKGIGRINQGIVANEKHIEQQMGKVIDVGEKIQQETRAMPKGGMTNGLARVAKAMEIAKREWGKPIES